MNFSQVESRGAKLLLEAMRKHLSSETVQEKGANVSWSVELGEKILEASWKVPSHVYIYIYM